MPDILDYKQILSDSVAFTRKEVGSTWSKIKPYADHEFTQFAENAFFLARLKLTGVIEADELKSRLQMQKLAMQNVLRAIKGVGIVTAQNVVNGVLDIVSGAIKKAINIILPV